MNLFKKLLLVLFIGIFSCTKTELVEPPASDIFVDNPAAIEIFYGLLNKTTQIRDLALKEYIHIDRKESVVYGSFSNTCILGFSNASTLRYHIDGNEDTRMLLADAISFVIKIDNSGENDVAASNNRMAIKDKLIEELKFKQVGNKDYLMVSFNPDTEKYCKYVLETLNEDLAAIVTEIVTVGNQPNEIFEEI